MNLVDLVKRLMCGLAVLAHTATADANIHFDDVTSLVGISNVGPSWGASWGDFNGDGLPDLWTSNHNRAESLYLNMADHFVDIGPEVISGAGSDAHGAAWADFDNDGDQDLIQLADVGWNSLFVNLDNLTLQNQAYSFGLSLPHVRGRTPQWFDYDRDGRLDLMVTSAQRASDPDSYNLLFRQHAGVFTIVNDIVGLLPTASMNFMLMTDLTSDFTMELVPGTNPFPEAIYDTSQIPFAQINLLSPVSGVVDVAVADFNGDLKNDIFSVYGLPSSELLQVDDFLVEGHINAASGVEPGINLTTPGDLFVDFAPNWVVRSDTVVYAGSTGQMLSDEGYDFMLDADDPAYHGMPPHTAGSDRGIYVGFDPAAEIWSLRFSNLAYELNVEIISVEPISNLESIGFDDGSQWSRPDTLLVRDENGFNDYSSAAGVDFTSWGRSVVAGDFDNDMDLDIYILATGHTRNRPNIVYENIGNAVFVQVADSGGAGPVQGKGDAIAMADYDVDGYLDLFLTNGKSHADWDQDGPVKLLRNSGGSNNWLQIDLEGVDSNRDGIGSIVFATAGGVTQIREQGGGMHYRAQNHQRLHFGLADNQVVESVVVHWPNGIVQELTDVQANQVVTIVEPAPEPVEPSCVYNNRTGKFELDAVMVDLQSLIGGILCIDPQPGPFGPYLQPAHR